MNRALQTFAVLTTVGMFLVLLAGALVTNTGSADGCGNTWPLCYGEFRPLATLSSLIEYSHRAITGLVGIMVGILAVWTWRTFRQRYDVKWLSFASVFFVLLQSALGAAAVMWPQSEAVLALHFGFSSLGLSSVLLLSVITFEQNKIKPLPGVSKRYRNLVWGIFIYIYGLIYLGAYVRRIGAGLSIDTWPLNNGQLIPDDLFSIVGVSFVHRLAALVGLVLILGLFVGTKLKYPGRKDLFVGSIMCLATIILQIFSGGYVILSQLSVGSLMLHSTFVSIFFGSLSYLCYQVTVNSWIVKNCGVKNIRVENDDEMNPSSLSI